MIENSLAKVEIGTRIADETAAALKAIVEEINTATELIKLIAISSEEQVDSIKQINTGISQVSQVVQTNAANSEEAPPQVKSLLVRLSS
jgi:methyl-accepting chemotaxis protein